MRGADLSPDAGPYGPAGLSGAAQNRHALCMCIEKGLGVEVSERVQYIRTIMDGCSASIRTTCCFAKCLCMDMGALTAFFYGFRDREGVDILEQTTRPSDTDL